MNHRRPAARTAGALLALAVPASALARPPAPPAAPSTAQPPFAAERAAIERLRQDNNRAIAARDLPGVMAMAADDYVAVGGADAIMRSRDQMRAFWTADFAAAQPVARCTRTPTAIEVGQDAAILRAAESGRWQCPHDTPSGPAAPYGAYFAHWSKRSGAWRLVSDNYVTLGCRGAGC